MYESFEDIFDELNLMKKDYETKHIKYNLKTLEKVLKNIYFY